MDKLFAYGTLMEEAFLREHIGRVPPSQRAVLKGFRAGMHPSAPHAIAEPEAGASIPGKVYEGVTPDEFEAIDRYEGVPERLYRRVAVTVEVGAWRADAWMYTKY